MNHDAEHREYEAHLNWLASIPVLAEFTQHHRDGEAGISTMIYPKFLEATPEESEQGKEVGQRITKVDALEASGMQPRSDTTMGAVQTSAPTVKGAEGIWIVQQYWYANV